MLFDENGTAVKLFGTDQDITEQKQAEEELQRAKDLYQRIVETTREGILILDAQDIISSSTREWGRSSATRSRR